jgi:hypothetical protein
MHFLNSYEPLAYSAEGQSAARTCRIPPFVDASCRREPDFEREFPGISALCRKQYFAPRLQIGNHVAYITIKQKYYEGLGRHWCLVALLKVVQRFESHAEAAEWYRSCSKALPNNCMVSGNPPRVARETHSPNANIKAWDETYRKRAETWGVFCATEALFRNLVSPPALTEKDMLRIFGKLVNTRMPQCISADQFTQLLNFVNGRKEKLIVQPQPSRSKSRKQAPLLCGTVPRCAGGC